MALTHEDFVRLGSNPVARHGPFTTPEDGETVAVQLGLAHDGVGFSSDDQIAILSGRRGSAEGYNLRVYARPQSTMASRP